MNKLKQKASNRYQAFQRIIEQELHIKMEKELIFAPPRKWRFDFYIIEYKIAIEIDGGSFKQTYYKDKTGQVKSHTGGRHNTAEGFIEDMEKLNTATVLGWKVLRFTPDQLYTVKTLETIKKLIHG
jgi:very-short-patch-repair endonuclease